MFADIQSSNIVGYTAKDAAQGKFIILGAPFEAVAGGTQLNDLISSGISGTDYGDGKTFKTLATQVQIPDGAGYKTFYYLNDGYYEDAAGKEAYKAGWCDGDGTIVDVEMTPGVAFWFKSISTAATPTVAGAVSSDNTAEVSCPTGFALRANTFPMALDLNGDNCTSDDIKGVDYGDGKAFKTLATQVQIPDGAGYKTFYYLNDGYYEDAAGKEAYKAGWCDGDGTIVDVEVPTMQGFWTKGVSGAFTLKFSK